MMGGPQIIHLFIGFSIINHPFWGTPFFWKHPYGWYIHQTFQVPKMEVRNTYTSRAGQAGGGSFQKKTPISQRKNLPIECAQGDRPARCPFHARDPRVWVDARHQITATVPNHRTVRAATKRHLQSMRQQHATGRPQRQAWQAVLQSTATYYRITYETAFTLRGATRVSLQLRQILRLPRKMVLMIDVPHIWNVIYNARSNKHHPPHQILRLPRYMTLMIDPRDIWNIIYNARSNRHHPPTSPNTVPATKNDAHHRLSWHMKHHLQCAEQQASPSNLTKYCACHEKWCASSVVVTYETSFTMRGATGITLQPHQILRLPRKMMRIIDPRHIWNVIYNARSNKHHPPTSPNTAPATQNDSHDWCPSHMKRHLQCAEQQASPSNLTKYCACHAKLHSKILEKLSENSWSVIYNARPIRAWSEHDPSMIRPWTRHLAPARSRRLHFALRRRILYWKLQHFALRLSTQISPNTAPATKSDTPTSPNTAPATKSDTPTSPNAAPATKSDTPTSPNTAPATKSETVTELLLNWAVTKLLLSCY